MLQAEHLFLQFGRQPLFRDLCLSVENGRILSVIGPNGSGKSTLLKALARNIRPQQGAILLDGKLLQSYSRESLARCMAFLPQTPGIPSDVTVRELVSYGRFPYQAWWKNTRKQDNDAVDRALEETGIMPLESRLVNTLSGGERQRVWLAMALAQEPRVLLLDEPTTYLDIAHQLEILSLITRLNKIQGITVVMVLHEINHAARYAHCVAVMENGGLFAVGTPQEVITKEMLREVFGVEAEVWQDADQCPVCIARGLAEVAENLSCKDI